MLTNTRFIHQAFVGYGNLSPSNSLFGMPDVRYTFTKPKWPDGSLVPIAEPESPEELEEKQATITRITNAM